MTAEALYVLTEMLQAAAWAEHLVQPEMNASLGGIMCDSGGASEPLFVLAAVALGV